MVNGAKKIGHRVISYARVLHIYSYRFVLNPKTTFGILELKNKARGKIVQEKYGVVGKILFKAWYKEKFGNLVAFAASTGINYKTVWSWLHGVSLPTLQHACLVEDLSKGQVPARSWLDPLKLKQHLKGHPHKKAKNKKKAQQEGTRLKRRAARK